MKLAISNIAWHPNEENTVARIMQDMNIRGVEIAPTNVWDSPLTANDADIKDYRRFWESQGIQIVAMQALLFGRADLTIFGSIENRRKTFDYLSQMIQLGGKLGAKVLVFGSPKNRKVGNLSQGEIEHIAVPFFRDLGQVAIENGSIFCIEPNPTIYGCDFITTSGQGLELVRKVSSQGFGLHLDAAAMTLSQEPIESAIEASFAWLQHFHISEPQLARIGTGDVAHSAFARILDRLHYKNWGSIEMKTQSTDSCIESVVRALRQSLDYYSPNNFQYH